MKLEKQKKSTEAEILHLTTKARGLQFKYDDIFEQFDQLKSSSVVDKQDLEHTTTQFYQMRDKYLRLERDFENL